MARLFAAVAVLASAALLLALFWPQLFGLQRAPLFAQVVALRGASAVAAVVAALVCTVIALLIGRARRFFGSLALLALVFAAANGVILTDRGYGGPGFESPTENDVTVLAWNTLGDAVSVDELSDLVIETGADIVALPETTEGVADEVAARARSAGLALSSYTVAYDQVAKARSTSLLISSELGPYVLTGSGSTGTLPSVVATSTAGGPTIVAVHAVAPVPYEISTWRSDLRILAELCGDPNVVLAGDFNATLDSFAGLGHAPESAPETPQGDLGACRDAAEEVGAAALGTWPSGLPALVGTPIDHVLATPNWRVAGFRVISDRDGAGSDHRPVLAQLTPAG